MAVRISYCHFRLLFKQPFGTAHGVRTGTDALFVRVQESGHVGFGEITLPPYLRETIGIGIEGLRSMASLGLGAEELRNAIETDSRLLQDRPGCRTGLHTALLDLLATSQNVNIRTHLGLSGTRDPVTMMTVGICSPKEAAGAVAQLPMSGALKVKVGDPEAHSRIKMLKQLDNRMLFLDGNQGMASVDQAVDLVNAVGAERLIGFEQPFGTDSDPDNGILATRTGVTVFADESIQDLADLDARRGSFAGLNIKLMKCGGLDRALALVLAGRQHGMRIMLGSMSESSVGCTAMAQLAGEAEIADLDGPWLISNDPFSGIGMRNGKLVLPDGPGLGVHLKAKLDFEPIGP